MKTSLLIALGLLATPLLAQPPELRKPVALPISLEEANTLLGGPTLITLHLKDVTPPHILKEFSRLSGVTVQFQDRGDEGEKLVAIDLDNQPFWAAMREICTKLHVTPNQFGISEDSTMKLAPDGIGLSSGAMILLNPLVSLRLDRITHTQTLNLQGNDTEVKVAGADHSLFLQGTFLFDPKLRLIPDMMGFRAGVFGFMTDNRHPKIIEAVDEKGVSMAKEGALVYSQMPLMLQLQVPFNWRADMGKKLVSLRGTAKCFVFTKREVWEVPDALNAKEISKTVRGQDGERTYTFLGASKTRRGYQMRVKVDEGARMPRAMQFDAFQLLNGGREVKLLDADGRSLSSSGSHLTSNLLEYDFVQDQAGIGEPVAPMKMVLDIPLELRELEVPFELKDLPLP